MNVSESVRGFIDDVWRLPLIFKLVVLYGVGAAGWGWWQQRRHAEMLAASESWPVHRARVVWAQVTDRQSGGEDGPSYWEGVLTYSYTVPGQELEVGEYRKRFHDEEEADAWARGLRDTFVDVRVDPADAKRSVWQEGPVFTQPKFQGGAVDRLVADEAEGWGIRETAALLVLCASALGALVALWCQLSCFQGKPKITAEGNTRAFFAMHIGAMICAIVAQTLFPKSGSSFSMSTRQWWEFYRDDSLAVFIVRILSMYTCAVFLYAWVRTAADPNEQSYWGILMFSTVWLFIYTVAAFTCLRALQDGEKEKMAAN
jgi:hypothetical protein